VAASVHMMPDEDRWIISRVNSLAAQVDSSMKECQLHRATRGIVTFILEDLSRWYIQLVRERMWLEGESTSKRHAYETIYFVLRRLAGILAPFCPHIAETMYGNLRCSGDPESVHLLDWSAGDATLTDSALEADMACAQSFDEAAANARQAGKRKLRWPVAECVVVTGAGTVLDAITRLNAVCRERANSRKVTVVEGRWNRIGWKAEPVMKALGPAFGKNSPKVRAAIERTDGTALKATLDAQGTAMLNNGPDTFEITAAHVTFTEQLPADVFSAPMKDATVYVDVALFPDIEAEGYAREVIRRVQEMRRQLDLAVEDFITVDVIIGDERVCELIHVTWHDGIADEVRAKELVIRKGGGQAPAAGAPDLRKDWDVEGVLITIGISKVPN
jgi:isoleucyl-tRNA synthetase